MYLFVFYYSLMLIFSKECTFIVFYSGNMSYFIKMVIILFSKVVHVLKNILTHSSEKY